MTIDAPPLAIEGTRKRPRLDTTRRDEGIPTLKEEQQPPFKRIRFAATSSGQIKTLSIPADLSHTDLNKNDLWWTRADRSDISEASREIVKDYKDSHPSQVEHLIHVFQQCAQKPSASTSEYLEQATACVPPIVRGLEWGIIPASKTYRRTHVHQVLQLQDQIRGLLQTEMRSTWLSTRASRSSRPSRVMARLLGEGDYALLQEEEDSLPPPVDDDDDNTTVPLDTTTPSDLHTHSI
jgi:hypothetical protein